MSLWRILRAMLPGVCAAVILAGCHYDGHLPPGQLKKVINPPPGHGGVPPGQMKKM